MGYKMRLCIFEFYADPCGAERGELGAERRELGGGAMVSVELRLERFMFPFWGTIK